MFREVLTRLAESASDQGEEQVAHLHVYFVYVCVVVGGGRGRGALIQSGIISLHLVPHMVSSAERFSDIYSSRYLPLIY